MEDENAFYWSTRFRNPDPKEAYIEMDFPNFLSQEDRQFIKRKVSIDEIKKVVWDCGTDKAPGPDGFTFGFCRRYWDLIHGDVTNAVRLVSVIKGLINEVQSAFIAERQILDGPFILNEVIQWCKLKKNQILIFKVDFEKAYDSVRWDFLDEVLRKFGFGDKWYGELVHRAARQLRCLVLNLSFSYLGSIVGDNMARQQACGGIVDRVKKKLSK
nr:RNA-directed DNA polymerase, eukaryota, reverse transcriptase zinc-binding domain protein [Tanacetum cinerariifolium]